MGNGPADSPYHVHITSVHVQIHLPVDPQSVPTTSDITQRETESPSDDGAYANVHEVT